MSDVLDLIDQAQQQCELTLAAQLANAAKPVPKLPYTGDCYNPICANTRQRLSLFVAGLVLKYTHIPSTLSTRKGNAQPC